MDPELLDRAILELASGAPEPCVVDKRLLRVLLGPLADLIVCAPMMGPRPGGSAYDPDADGYVWDRDDLC